MQRRVAEQRIANRLLRESHRLALKQRRTGVKCRLAEESTLLNI